MSEATSIPGKIDLVIFPNGGKEVIGRQPSMPPTQEYMYWPKVLDFVKDNQGLEKPTKFTGIYTVKNGTITMKWYPYQGSDEPEETEMGPEIPDMDMG